MEHICPWNIDNWSADCEFHPFVTDPILNQMNPAHTLLPRFFQSHFNVIVLYMPYVLVADIAGGKEAGDVWEHGVEENIWTLEGRGNGDCITRSYMICTPHPLLCGW